MLIFYLGSAKARFLGPRECRLIASNDEGIDPLVDVDGSKKKLEDEEACRKLLDQLKEVIRDGGGIRYQNERKRQGSGSKSPTMP
jgi:hypothetical protein